MIFDSRTVSALVMIWQQTKDTDTLARILDGSNSLIEAIVSNFDSYYREDLIQEARARLIFAMEFYNPKISSLHNYFTTVIRNRCATFLAREARQPDSHEEITQHDETGVDIGEELLLELIARNRQRFPSVDTQDVDGITGFIYDGFCLGGKCNAIIGDLLCRYDMSRSEAMVMYNSTIAYLRGQLKAYAADYKSDPSEFSLMWDVRELLGDELYQSYVLRFAGMNLRVSG